MGRLRFCHSVWAEPMFSDRWGVTNQLYHNLWMFALSVALVKKEGHYIVLHTDSKGKDLFGFLPYDEIHVTLDSLESSPLFWASGKMLAQQNEPLGSIHIDGDVFLTKPGLFDFMRPSRKDFIVQHLEHFDPESPLARPYTLAIDALTPVLSKVSIDFDLSLTNSFNCGLVKFNNSQLRDDYLFGYWSFLKAALADADVVGVLSGNKDIIPDLVLEQLWLYSLASRGGYKHSCFKSEDLLSKGFIHMVGKSKYSNNFMVKRLLVQTDLDLFYRVGNFLTSNGFNEFSHGY